MGFWKEQFSLVVISDTVLPAMVTEESSACCVLRSLVLEPKPQGSSFFCLLLGLAVGIMEQGISPPSVLFPSTTIFCHLCLLDSFQACVRDLLILLPVSRILASLRTVPDPAWSSQQSPQEAEPFLVTTLPDLIDHYFFVILMISLPTDAVPEPTQVFQCFPKSSGGRFRMSNSLSGSVFSDVGSY